MMQRKAGGDNKYGVRKQKTGLQMYQPDSRTRARSAALDKHRDIERVRVKGRERGDRGRIWGRHGADAGDRRHGGILWGRLS